MDVAVVGTAATLVALVLAVLTVATARGGVRRANRLLEAATGCATVAVGALVWALLAGDFRLAYVADTTTRSSSWPTRLAGLWGGMSGSLLLWTWLLLAVSVVGLRLLRRDLPALAATATAVLAAVAAAFLAVSAFLAGPFTRLAIPAIDGGGLVPILERPAMLYHPPLLYAGLVAMVAPFAIAVAGMWRDDMGPAWLAIVRRTTGAAWVVLTVGMVAGAHWAYGELGWGGFWAWDPIENASLLPWLAATALLHACLVDEHRDQAAPRLSTAILATVPFAFVVIGAALTRSGATSSVHAFAEATAVGQALLAVVVAVLALAAAATVRAWRGSPGGEGWSWSPRRAVLAVNGAILLGAGLVVATGTLYPLVAGSGGARAAVAGTFFSRFTAPLALLTVALVGVGPELRWSRGATPALRRRAPWAIAAMVGVGAGALALGVRQPFALAAVALAAGSATLLAAKLASQLRSPAPWSARRRAIGATLAHLGVVVLLVGVAGSTLTTATTVLLDEGDSAIVGPYTVRHDATSVREGTRSRSVVVRLAVLRDDEVVAELVPGQTVFSERGLVRADSSLRSTPVDDLQVVLRRLDADGTALLDVAVRPLVMWVWWGALVLAAGGALALSHGALAAGTRRERSDALAAAARSLSLR